MSEFEKAVRHALIDKDMTVSGLASKLGLSVSYTHELIRGTRKSSQHVKAIKEILGITGDDNEDV